jgi:hypothetical protein
MRSAASLASAGMAWLAVAVRICAWPSRSRTTREWTPPGSVEQDVQESLRTVQDGLVAAAAGAEPQYAAPCRTPSRRSAGPHRAVGITYEVALGEDLRDSWERVLMLCTASS